MDLNSIIKDITDFNDELAKLKKQKTTFINEYDELLVSLEYETKMSRIYLISNDIIKFICHNNNCLLNSTKLASINIKISELNKKITSFNKNINFDNKWIGGNHPGDIIDTPDGYRIRFDEQSRSFKFKNYKNTGTTIVCKDKDDCYIKAKEYLYEYYDGLDKVSNQYRYISPNHIEIKLTQNKTFITESKFIDKIIKYNLTAKYEKNYGKYYVMYLKEHKKHDLFYKVLTGYEQVKYKNGCSLDLREENLLNGDNSIKNDCNKIFNDIVIKNKDGYPINTWILGKYAGSVFQRKDENKWTVVVKKEDGTVVTKTLPFDKDNKDNKDDIYKKATEIKKNLSDIHGLTKNKIRIIDDNIIEVQLTKDQIMKTDYKFLDIIEKYHIYSSKSEGDNSKYYAGINYNNVNKLFHSIITGFEMVDHIDRDTLNNCISNLRKADHKLNNNNRSISDNSNAVVLGVTFCAKDNCFRARIKQDEREYSKQFSVGKYGYEEAKQMAINARREYNQIFNCANG